MKTVLGIGVGIVAVMTLVIVGLAVGWAIWGQRLWAAGMPAYGPGSDPGITDAYCGSWAYRRGQEMLGRGRVEAARCPAREDGAEAGLAVAPLMIEEAHNAAEEYLAAQGYPDLEVAEVMEFERNFYAIAQESGTGMGAMELLIDKQTGTVTPEMGPNMMWNTRYGMHRGRASVDSARERNTIPQDEAGTIAQRWLDVNRPGVTVEAHAEPFYGYYTLHTKEDGRIEGMLSVHGETGQVWYHTWHGAFVQMIEHDDNH